MRKGYLELNIFNWMKTNTTFKVNLYFGLIYVILYVMSFFIGNLIKPILTIVTLIWISIYWYIYRCRDVLTVRKFLFGYKERNDLCGSDAFFFKLLSNEFFIIM